MSEESEDKKPKENPTSVVHKLRYPIEWGSEMITEIKISRPKGKDIDHIKGEPSMKDNIRTASNCSKQPISVFKEMDGSDLISICEIVGDFLADGREIGDKN